MARRESVLMRAWLSGPCSACESRSAAMKAGSAAASAMTSTSLGPAGISMAIIASLFWSSILAAVTYWLPGPRILCTCAQAVSKYLQKSSRRSFKQVKQRLVLPADRALSNVGGEHMHPAPALALGQDAVPQAIAATACAPPAFRT